MKKAIKNYLLGLTYLIPVLLVLYFKDITSLPANNQIKSTQVIPQELKETLKKQILEEVQSEIQGIIHQEVETYLAGRPELDVDSRQLAKVRINEGRKDETKSQAIKRVVREVFQKGRENKTLSDEELDTYVASAVSTEYTLPNGYTKVRPEYLLAKAGSESSRSSNTNSTPPTAPGKKNLDLHAGAKKAESLERALVQRGGILLPKGTLQMENSLTYAEFSSNRINIQGFSILPVLVVGNISTQTTKRNVFIASTGFKYGLLHNLQVNVGIPYRYEHDRITDNQGGESTKDKGGLGDISIGVSRQIAWEHGWIPDTLASFSVKTATGEDQFNADVIGLGTGHWAVSSGLVFVKSSDPAVIFGSLNYSYSFPRSFDGQGRIEPGSSIGYSIGTAIALSYQTSINFGFDQSVTAKAKARGRTVDGSFVNSANFKTGFTWAMNEHTSLDVNVGIGLTTDSPDLNVIVKIPHTF